MQELGTHILVEFVEADEKVLNEESAIRQSMFQAAEDIQARVLHHHFHRFQPNGITGVILIAESHLTIHTWPEYGYAAVDIFTCGDDSSIRKSRG